MSAKHDRLLQESINHTTHSLPLSFHNTIVLPSLDSILYLHYHNESEFFYMEKGEAIFRIEDEQFYLKEGDGIFIPPNLLHVASRTNQTVCEFYAIVFSADYFLDFCSNSDYRKYIITFSQSNQNCALHLTSSTPWQKEILSLIKKMYLLSRTPFEEWELQMHGVFLIVWQLMYNHHFSRINIPQAISRLSSKLECTLEYIHQNYCDDLSLSTLAGISGYSDGQFCRLFNQLTNQTPFQYIKRYRILKSCEYLTGSTKKISEITTLCGFNNISYFHREFKKIMQTSPSSYRKAYLNHSDHAYTL